MTKKIILSEADQKAKKNLFRIWKREQKKRNFTQYSAADEISDKYGCKSSQAKIGHYLNGRRRLTVGAVLMFSSFLKVPPEEIRDDLDYGYRPDSNFSRLSEKDKNLCEAVVNAPEDVKCDIEAYALSADKIKRSRRHG